MTKTARYGSEADLSSIDNVRDGDVRQIKKRSQKSPQPSIAQAAKS